MSVVQLNADLELQMQLDGPLTWLLPAAGPRSVDRIAQLTRLSEANVPVCSIVDTVQPQRKTFYCRRCVFLNPVEVESPYWHAAWLLPDASVCEVHRLPFARINASLVRASINLPHLLRRVGRLELEHRKLMRPEVPKSRIGTILEHIGRI